MKPPLLPEPRADGLLIDDVGPWAAEKHHFLRRYMHAFLVAMGKKNWSGLHYLDLFAGPGILRLEDSRQLEWGSPLIAAQIPGFQALHLCEKRPRAFKALKTRISTLPDPPKVFWHQGDANHLIDKIVKNIQPRSLSLAFLDPFGLHLEFETLRILAERKSIDLVIFFPDRLDMMRNWLDVYFDEPDSNLDRYLGGIDWRRAMVDTPNSRRAEKFRLLYEENIRTLGFDEFEHVRIPSAGVPLYQLIYCSRNPAGSKIWRQIAKIQPHGQRTLDFGD